MGINNPTATSSAAASAITVGSTAITGGTTTRLLYDDAGTVGETTGVTFSSASAGTLTATTFVAGNGAASAAAFQLGTGAGLFAQNNAVVQVASGGTPGMWVDSTVARIGAAMTLGWASSGSPTDNLADVALSRAGVGSLAVLGSGATIAGTILASNAVLSGTLTYGGVTAASTVTGTGSLVLATNPTLSSLVATGTLTYGGVTFASTVTGTGSIVLATNPTLSSAVFASSATTTFTAGGTITYGGVTFASTVTGTGSVVLSAGPTFTSIINGAGLTLSASPTFQNAVAASASVTTTALQWSSTSSFGVMWAAMGSVVPTLAATQGCLLINTTGSSTATRMYVKTSAAGTWTNFTTAA